MGNALIRSAGKAVQPQREGSVTDGLLLIAAVEQHAVGAGAGHERRPVRRQDAVLPLQDALRQALRENVEAGNRALSCGESAEWEEHSKQFHKIFYAYTQSPCLDEADAKLRPRLELLSCIYYQSASREKINKEHNEILRLVLDDNFEAAQKLMRAHLECDMLYAIKGYHAIRRICNMRKKQSCSGSRTAFCMFGCRCLFLFSLL